MMNRHLNIRLVFHSALMYDGLAATVIVALTQSFAQQKLPLNK